MNKKELTQVVKLVQSDREQFEQLYSQIINKIYYWCYIMSNNEAMAKDMAQEAVVRIYNKLDEVKQPEYFSSWMYRVVRNSCMNYLRKVNSNSTEILYDDINDNMITNIKDIRIENLPDKAYNLQETKEIVREFIDNLPKKQKEVIVLYYLEEFKTPEIAKILDCNINAVRVRLHSGRKTLELKINEYQTKNNVKLYNSSLLTIIGGALKISIDELCSKQDLQVANNLTANTSGVGSASVGSVGGASTVTFGGLALITSKFVIIIVSIVCVCAAVVVADALFNTSDDSSEISNNNLKAPSTANEEIAKKLEGHPYIEDIVYMDFPMRDYVDISVKLKQDIEVEYIKIQFNGEELAFDQYEDNILVRAKVNGVYMIDINDIDVSIKINNIDQNAPELREVLNEKNHLLLNIDGELSQVDFTNSYIEYQGKEYLISDNLKIYGMFHGEIKVVLYTKSGAFIRYSVEI